MNVQISVGKNGNDIAERIAEIIKSEKQPQNSTPPSNLMIIVRKYLKKNNGKLGREYLVAMLPENPLIYDECDEGDQMIYIATRNNYFIHNHNKTNTRMEGNIYIPKSANIVDWDSQLCSDETDFPFKNMPGPATENTVDVMVCQTNSRYL